VQKHTFILEESLILVVGEPKKTQDRGDSRWVRGGKHLCDPSDIPALLKNLV